MTSETCHNVVNSEIYHYIERDSLKGVIITRLVVSLDLVTYTIKPVVRGSSDEILPVI